MTPSAVEIDLEHAVNRLAYDGKLVERGHEQALLRRAVDCGDQNDQAGMHRLRRVELAEIARIIGHEDEISGARVAHDIPVLPASAADMRDVLGFMAGFPGDGDQWASFLSLRPCLSGYSIHSSAGFPF